MKWKTNLWLDLLVSFKIEINDFVRTVFDIKDVLIKNDLVLRHGEQQ